MHAQNKISIGLPFTWTLKSPRETNHSSEEFDSFVKDNIILVRNDSHITGCVIYNDGKSAVVEIKEMTPCLFPFTLFYNEVENRFPNLNFQNDDPYKKYFCMDVASMTSLFCYDIDTSCLADAVYNEEGDFDYYDMSEVSLNGAVPVSPENADDAISEQLIIQLKEHEIEELEDKEVIQLQLSDEIRKMAETEDGNFAILPCYCSLNRTVSWFNAKDCAILTAWRNGKVRKTNDDNNRKLQAQLRDLGYGVTKITGWYPEKDKELARENSFLAINLNDEYSFRDNIFQLSERYEQDCFLYKKAGYDTPAVYVYTNDDCGKGKVKLVGRLRIGNLDAEAFSQVKTGRITFE